MKKLINFLAAMFIGCLFFSCATTVSATRQRPSELDLGGANSISVLPIQTSKYDEDTISFLGFFTIKVMDDNAKQKQEIADYFTNQLQDTLLNSDYLTVIGSKRVEEAISHGTKIPCDVYLTGYITNWENSIPSDARKDADGKIHNEFHRALKYTLVYQVIDAESGKIIASKSRDFTSSSLTFDDKAKIPSPLSMTKSDLDYLISSIMRQLQPYTETKYISLMQDKTKNPELAQAESFAKSGIYETAEQMYLEIYNRDGDLVSGYNAACIMQIRGKYDEAEELMTALCNKYNDKKAYSALRDIQSEKKAEDALKQQQLKRNQ